MRNKLLFFVALFVAMFIPQSVMAYNFSATVSSGQTLYFTYTSNGGVYVDRPRTGVADYNSYEGHTKPSGNLVISGSVMYNGVKWDIEYISSYAFYGCSGLTSVSISDSIESIGSYAFYGCTGLRSIIIGNGVYSIGGSAFYNCMSLNSITIYRTNCLAQSTSFNGVSANATVNVPCGTSAAYAAATGWSQFNNFVEMAATYMATVSSANTTMGTATANACGNIITATANDGYHFAQWNDGNSANPRTLTLTANASFTAIFAPNQYIVTGSGLSGGSVAGGGSVDYLDSITLTAIPNEGYRFVKWCTMTGSIYEDYSTNNPLIVEVTNDATYYAIFEQIPCIVTALPSDSTMGYTTGSGTVYYGNSVQIRAYANYGYRFIGWTDGYSSYSRNVYVTSDTTFTALFEPIPQYVISVGSNNSTMGTVSGGGTYYENTNISISATPNTGCRFTGWSDGISTNPRTINVYQDTAFTAVFEYIDYIIKVQTNNSLRGTVDGTDTVHYGETVTLIATPNEHITFQYWQSSNGTTHGDNPLTLTVTSSGTYTAYFAAEQHSVAVYSDGGGTVRIGSSGNIGNYDYFSQLTLTATANGNNAFLRWNDGNSFNPRTVTVTQDTTFTALFLNGTTYLHDTIIDTVYFNHYTHDTTYINNYIHDTVRFTTYLIDTTIVNLHQYDTTINNYYQYDTVFINNYQHDTTLRYVYDTVYLLRYLTDTVFIHDTIYTTEGINNVDVLNAKVYTNRSQIFVEGADGNTVTLFDINGRVLATKQDYYSQLVFDAPASGTYLIKIGNHPARKVVVIR